MVFVGYIFVPRKCCVSFTTRMILKRLSFSNNIFIKGPSTIHVPSGEEMRVFEACSRYNPRYRQGIVDTPLVVLAGKDFGKGTNREWAVKGASVVTDVQMSSLRDH